MYKNPIYSTYNSYNEGLKMVNPLKKEFKIIFDIPQSWLAARMAFL